MNLIKFLWSASPVSTLTIIILSSVNGIAGGILLILIPDAALNIFSTDRFWFYAVSLPVTIIVFLVSRHLSQQKTEILAEKALEDMVLRITNSVRHAELKEFEQYKNSDILLSIANAQTISSAAGRNMESLQAYVTLFIGWLYIFFFLSHLFGLFLLLARFVLLMIQEMFGKIIRAYAQEQMKEEKRMFNIFQSHLYGFKELKFNQKKNDDIFHNHLLPRIENCKKIRIKSRRFGSELLIINILFNLTVMACCSAMSFTQDISMRIIIILLFNLQNDILINSSKQNIAEGNVALARLRQLFQGKNLRKADEDISMPPQKGMDDFHSITMENIQFAYPLSHDVQGFSIHIENLTVKSKEILFITGGNGSGKSTFMNILAGLYSPDTGIIKIDNRAVSAASYRHMFSAVFADFHLFDQFYGMEAVDEDHVNELLRLTELEGKTAYGQNRFSTLDLSAGQRRRLALVIAMMEDRPVFLFDEWAADQDPYFRRYFYESILPSLKEKGKTVIAITHDDRYFHIADKVIRMEYGKIAEYRQPGQTKQIHPLFPHKSMPFTSKKEIPFSAAEYMETEKEGPETEDRHNVFLKQVNQIVSEDRSLLLKIFGLLFMFSGSFVGLTVILVHMPQMTAVRGIWYIWFIFLLISVVISFRRLQKNFYHTVENRIADLRISVMDNARKTDLLTLKQIGEGRIYSYLTSDIKAVAETSDIILLCIQGGLRTIMIYAYIAVLYPPAFVLMLFLTIIGVSMYCFNHIKMINLFEQVRDREKKLSDSVHHLLKGFKELKLSVRKSNDFYHKSIRYHVSRLQNMKLRSVRYYISNSTITYGFWQGILLMMILVMPFFWSPAAILPVAVGLVLTMPLRQIIDRYSKFHMAYMSIQRLFQFENKMKHLKEDSVRAKVPDSFENLQYRDISFIYKTKDSHPFFIGPMSMTFKPGEIVFITGGNGSGKSTLLNIISGLYPADSGEIFINNDKNTDIQAHRELFSPIFTDFHLFDRLYGMEKVDETKLSSLLKLFRLYEKVKYTDGKFTTLDLSAGQKKRMAMLVTMMEDKPVYVFDEWAAEQDPHFREYFYLKLLPEFKAQGKTVIAVTHDDRYFHAADRVLHLESGQLIHT